MSRAASVVAAHAVGADDEGAVMGHDTIAQQRATEAAAALAACGMDVDTLTGFTPYGRFDEGILVETGWWVVHGTGEMGPVQYRARYQVDGSDIAGEWRSFAARAYADAAEMRLSYQVVDERTRERALVEELRAAGKVLATIVEDRIADPSERFEGALRRWARANWRWKRSTETVRYGTCRVCGCTDHDCRGCIERTGEPCHWVEADLCSACVGREDGRG